MNQEINYLKEKINSVFNNHFGNPEAWKFAPGRANIIGEHTDYNQGFVLPFAIEQGILFAGSRRADQIISIISLDKGQEITLEIGTEMIAKYGWDAFFIQVIQLLIPKNTNGFNLVFGGNLPIGAGISSSSAITCGLISILDELYDLKLDDETMVERAVQAEVGYGVLGGMMDQFTIFNGQADTAILLDCKSLTTEYIPLALDGGHFYLFNTNVKHNLIDTDYNNRRKQCDKAVSIISEKYRPINALRNLSSTELPALNSILDETLYSRVSFVVNENERVLDAVEAIKSKDYKLLGQLLKASHIGLSELYEVSCVELDWLVTYVESDVHFFGSRMMGGGFGGCTINFVADILDESFQEEIKADYFRKFLIELDIIPIKGCDGILNFSLKNH